MMKKELECKLQHCLDSKLFRDKASKELEFGTLGSGNMSQDVKRKKSPFGKMLRGLHSWKAWLVAVLTVTGVLLFLPDFRTDFSQIRVWTKQLHIVLGVVSIIVVLLYLPLIGKHLRQLRAKPVQRWNLIIVLFILAGWSLTGLILWQFRNLPPAWSNFALILHDLFTWVGVPYAIYHSISRMRWVKRANYVPSIDSEIPAQSNEFVERVTQAYHRAASMSPISRRTFIRLALGFLLVIAVGPAFFRWMKGTLEADKGGVAGLVPADPNQAARTDASQMIPPPSPLPESLQPLGGGAEGDFRYYTVTAMPDSSVDSWVFTVSGLVDRPMNVNWDAFLKLPRTVQVSDFHCVTGWSVYNCTWEGIALKQLLDMAGVKSHAKNVKFYSGDGVYTDTLTLDQAQMDDVMVVCLLDGKPIPKKLGGPVRLVVPQMYAYKSVKWLQGIELIDQDHIGYWENLGYDTDAWVAQKRLRS